MRNLFKFFLSPKTFFNQLQWSSRHYLILATFLGLAAVETYVGKHEQLYALFATLLQKRFHLSLNQALWAITFTKLLAMVSGAFIVSTILWTVAKFLGIHSSRRVLARRLAIVFTVLLGGYTLHHFANGSELIHYTVVGLYVWGSVLGYYALKEQFRLNYVEAVLASVATFLLVVGLWHFTTVTTMQVARSEVRKASHSDYVAFPETRVKKSKHKRRHR